MLKSLTENALTKFINAIVCLLIGDCMLVIANAPIITSVGYAFETFTPYAMIRFFEFSDKEWNITENCFSDMYEYVEVYDASSYYGGSVFAGSTVRLHNPHLCRFLSQQYKKYKNKLDDFAYVISFDVQIVSAHYLMEIAFDNYYKYEKIQQLICFPKSCRNWDFKEILEVFPFHSNGYVRNNSYLRHRIVQDNYRIFEDFNFYIMIIIIGSSLLIHLTVYLVKRHLTLMSIYRQKDVIPKVFGSLKPTTLASYKTNDSPLYENTDNVGDNLPKIVITSKTYFFENLLETISIPSVVYNLVQRDPLPISGIMVAFTISYLCVHLVAEITFTANNMEFGVIGNKVEQLDQILKRSAFLMDLYFLINGTYLAYGFLKNFPKDELSVFEQLTYIWKSILHKLFGLTPSYIFILYAAQLLDKHFYYNNTLEIPSRDFKNCPQRLLGNLFYIDTFFPLIERCMPWTWFISLEIQFFIMGCLIMLLVKVHVCYAVVIGFSIFIIAWLAATMWLLEPYEEYGYSTTLYYELMSFNLVLDNVCLFIMPYLLGLCLGYVIFKSNHNLNMKLCFLVADILNNVLNFKYTHTLEQPTSICLLLAPLIIRFILFSADTPIYWSIGQVVLLGIGCLLLTYVFSLILYILLQGPVVAALESLIVNGSSN
uniref:Nose resistant-to-fluoxetine protein N-terminal domain-containing protein n=1 Tax=Glossina brevipalpis TaxID=37001 RepID=A0A1A9W9H3_9MUSC